MDLVLRGRGDNRVWPAGGREDGGLGDVGDDQVEAELLGEPRSDPERRLRFGRAVDSNDY